MNGKITTQPKRPGSGWFGGLSHPSMPHATVWSNGARTIQVISAVEIVEETALGIVFPSYHVSALIVDRRGHVLRACSNEEIDTVRESFQMDGADEDNHGEGFARHLWLRVGARLEEPCPCKEDEPTTVDGPREWRP